MWQLQLLSAQQEQMLQQRARGDLIVIELWLKRLTCHRDCMYLRQFLSCVFT
jgi:hypothetical protein